MRRSLFVAFFLIALARIHGYTSYAQERVIGDGTLVTVETAQAEALSKESRIQYSTFL